jgi:hypothetical protein
MAFNGLAWVGVRLDEGGFVSCVVDSTHGCLRNKLLVLGPDPMNVAELKPDEDPHGEDSFAIALMREFLVGPQNNEMKLTRDPPSIK